MPQSNYKDTLVYDKQTIQGLEQSTEPLSEEENEKTVCVAHVERHGPMC